MMNNLSDDARNIADQVARRERRRVRLLVALTIGFWILAALLILSVYLPVGAKLHFYGKMLQRGAPANYRFDPDRNDAALPVPAMQDVPAAVAELQHQQWITGQVVAGEWVVGLIILGLALAAGMLASVSTVALALTIRRVTLRQVSDSLAHISEQLRQLQRPPG